MLAPREKEMLPSISLVLSVNKIDLHLSTEILNQILVVQSSFVKVCEYCACQMFAVTGVFCWHLLGSG